MTLKRSIATNHIILRQKELSDAQDDYRWQTDAGLAQLDATPVLNMTFPRYLAEYNLILCYPPPDRREFAIDTQDGIHIGNCVYYNINYQERKTAIGIMIGERSYWNKGYGTHAVSALLEKIFTRTSLNNVYLNTLSWNARAQGCFRKCGFINSGQFTKDDSTFLIMELSRQNWGKQAIK